MSARVEVIGVAPGAARLPDDAVEAARSCRLLVGAERHLALVPGFDGEVVRLEGNLLPTIERVAGCPQLRAAFLASGDPGFFGVAATVLRALPPEEVRIRPAVSSMQLAFARAGEPWSDARFASLHGRRLEELAPVLGAPRVGVFTDARNGPAAVARYLAEAGWGDLEVVVLEELGSAGERLSRGLASELTGWAGSELNVVLLLRRGPDPRPLGLGLPDEAFSHSRGLITKAETRAAVLGLLRLPRDGVLWDVGAGSGSISVEACLLAPALRAYAVERSPEALAHVAENRRRFRVAALNPVGGEAPEAFRALPDPDAVFVGGSGGRLREVLDGAWARLRPGGRLVLSSVLLETTGDGLAWAKARGLPGEIVHLQAARGRAVAGRHLLEPQHPITLLACTKAEVPGGDS